MADGAVVFDVELDSSKITSALSGLARNLGIGVIGAEIGSKLGDAVKRAFEATLSSGMDFGSAMSKVAAVYETDLKGVAELTAAAKRLGETTKFTAVEAANAIVELGQAGLTQAQALTVLPEVLSLAAAGGLGIAEAAAITAVGMNTMALNADELGTLVDQLAVGAAAAATDVSSLGQAFSFVGSIGQYLAGGTAEVVSALGLLSNAGIDASTGGIKLRNIITRLISPIDQAAEQLNALGVSVATAEGKMRPMPDIFSDLQKSMEGMTEVEKATALSEIFNTEDLAAANALMNAVGEGWTDMMEAVTSSDGAADSMASTMLDNLEGDVTLLKSAGEGLGLAFYEGVEPQLRAATQVATDTTQALTDLANVWNGNEAFISQEDVENLFTPLDKSPWEIIWGSEEAGTKKSLLDYLLPSAGAEGEEAIPETITQQAQTIAEDVSDEFDKALVEAFQNGEISYAELVAAAFGGTEGVSIEDQMAEIYAQMETIGAQMKASLIAGMTGGGEGGEGAAAGAAGEAGEGGEDAGMLALGLSLAQSVAKGITNGAPDIKTELTKATDAARSAVKIEDFNTLGKNIAQGVADGIKAGSTAISEALVSAVLSALKAAEEAAGVHSPSTLFRDKLGRWLPAGAAEGVKLEAWQLRQACRDMVNDSARDMGRYAQKEVINIIQRDIKKHSLPVSFGWQDAKIARGAAKSMQVEQTNNFNVPVQTPDEFAETMQMFLTYGLEADW